MRIYNCNETELVLDESNARTHDERNLDAIAESLRKFGQVEPLVVQRKGDALHVIGGNGRLEAMRALGWGTVTVCEVDVDDDQARALAITLNRTAELASWDESELIRQLREMEPEERESVGFTDDDIRVIESAMLAAAEEPEPEPSGDGFGPRPDPAIQAGDVWMLGRNEFHVGDVPREQLQLVELFFKTWEQSTGHPARLRLEDGTHVPFEVARKMRGVVLERTSSLDAEAFGQGISLEEMDQALDTLLGSE